MICKIGFYASSVRWMGSCHWNEKHVLRYIIRTRCKHYKRDISYCVRACPKGIVHKMHVAICGNVFLQAQGNVFDIHSITIGDILFGVLNRQIFEFENPSPVLSKRIVSVIKYSSLPLNGHVQHHHVWKSAVPHLWCSHSCRPHS